MKKIPLILFLLFTLLPSLTALNTKDYLQETDRLKEAGQYRSAWNYLHENAAAIPFSTMMARKTELCIRYYAATNLFQMFSFVNLKEGETLEGIRRAGHSLDDMKLFDPAGGLLTALKEEPENGELHYWLGEFYFNLLHLFGPDGGMEEKELSHQIIIHYRKALEKGWQDEYLLANLAYTELTEQDWSSAALHFGNALDQNSQNPSYHYNLAMALMHTGELDKAERQIRLTLELEDSSLSHADTLYLGSTIALMMDDGEKSLEFLEKGREESPGDYRFPERLIQVYLVQGNWEKALENSKVLFDLYPYNPESCQTILNHFNAFHGLDRLSPFFQDELSRYREDPEAFGNLLYHQGAVSLILQKEEEAGKQLTAAEEAFRKVYPPNHEIFNIIKKLLDRPVSR